LCKEGSGIGFFSSASLTTLVLKVSQLQEPRRDDPVLFSGEFPKRNFLIEFGPQGDEETGGWRKLHNEELHNLYSSPSIMRIIKSRRMRLAGHVARMGRRGMHIGYWWENQKERDQ
jgi:hypothetical protein